MPNGNGISRSSIRVLECYGRMKWVLRICRQAKMSQCTFQCSSECLWQSKASNYILNCSLNHSRYSCLSSPTSSQYWNLDCDVPSQSHRDELLMDNKENQDRSRIINAQNNKKNDNRTTSHLQSSFLLKNWIKIYVREKIHQLLNIQIDNGRGGLSSVIPLNLLKDKVKRTLPTSNHIGYIVQDMKSIMEGISVAKLSHEICLRLKDKNVNVSKKFVTKIVYNYLKRLSPVTSMESERIEEFYQAHWKLNKDVNKIKFGGSKDSISKDSLTQLCDKYMLENPTTELSREQLYSSIVKLDRARRKQVLSEKMREEIYDLVDKLFTRNQTVQTICNDLQSSFPHIPRAQMYKLIYNRIMRSKLRLSSTQKEVINQTVDEYIRKDIYDTPIICDHLQQHPECKSIPRHVLYKLIRYRTSKELIKKEEYQKQILPIMQSSQGQSIDNLCDMVIESGVMLPRMTIERFIKKELRKTA